ncbi:MAG: NADH-quinone oxidoreductase subunit C [Parachlamydiaceae bacterium]|nr:NADH-quinone oxidoreductase subunit C [Parachlamydiaceae bacterium]
MNALTACQETKAKFGNAVLEEISCCGQRSLKVLKEGLIPILSFLKQEAGPGFEVLIDLTATDYLAPDPHTDILYFLYNPQNLERLCVILSAERLSAVPSVMGLWEGANWYERELFDLFGLKFLDHPDLKRILMPDDWVGHPLLRDYALTEESVQFKHGVKPKIPSAIIPHFKGKNDKIAE